MHKSQSSTGPRLMTTATAYPGRTDSMKYILFAAARAGMTVDQVRQELEAHGRGRGMRLNEYMADLRSENRITISIVP